MNIRRRLKSLVRRKPGAAPSADTFTKAAREALAERRFADAGALYVEALRLAPHRGDLHVQAGHMFKEAGQFDRAEHHYREADRLRPGDGDLALQFGHFYKITGRIGESIEAYRRADALMPGNPDIARELEQLDRLGWSSSGGGGDLIVASEHPLVDALDRPLLDPRLAADYERLALDQIPRSARQLVRRSEPSLNIQQFGVRLNTFWGMLPVARGVEAVRGFCISTDHLTTVTALMDGVVLKRQPMKGPYELEFEPDRGRIHKYVFNIWLDFSRFRPGRHKLELRFEDTQFRPRSLFQEFVVEPSLREVDWPNSDAVVDPPADPGADLEDVINARPSAVHEAKRPNMLPEIRSILVMRVDQLGDLVASLPGLTRLRELFPDARLVGLLGPANVDLARTLGVFDAIETVDFRESMAQRTRTLSLADQEELRDRLAPYQFDIAIDLAQSLMSRPLLALSGAPFLYGFHDPDWPRLTASVNDAYRDPKNHREIATHSTRILTMIDRLATLLKSGGKVVRRDDLDRGRLAALGIGDGERYAVLHTGARIIFSRWGHYPQLACRLHRDTDLKIVIFAEHPDYRSLLDADIAGSDRFVVIDGKLAFDDFDALLSYCSVYVGNDSGPKHLASLRGVPVVSIHSARINWSEWGQEHSGVVVTRKLPCAGCLVYHDVDECGKDFVCVTAISFDDVYGAVRRYV